MQKESILGRIIYSPVNYWGGFVIDLFAVGFFLVYGFRHSSGELLLALTCLVVGFLSWGLSEYILHRWVFHGPPSLAKWSHLQHHRHDKALIATFVFVVAISAFALWSLLRLVLPLGLSSLLVCGLYAGYVYYQLIHHAHHHWRQPIGHFKRLRTYHDIHHHWLVVNYGVTTTLWDRLFGTFAPRPRRGGAE